MKWIYGVGLAALLVGFLAAQHAMTALLTQYAPDMSAVTLFLDAHAIPKIIMFFCLLGQVFGMMTVLIGLVLALVRQPTAHAVELILAGLAAVLVTLGLLGGFYDWRIVQQAMAETGTTNPAVLAPARAEILVVISTGLFAGLWLLGGAALIRLVRAWRKPRAAAAA